MKELSIEEKAKRYDEALKEAVITHKDEDRHLKATLERIFPELKESGNIRIIKAIKYGLDHVFTNNTTVFEVTKEQCLAWLEKQGEQKSYGQRQECVNCQFNYAGECKGSCAMKRGEQKLNVNDNAKEMFIKALERVEEQNAKGYKLTDCDKNSWWEDFKAYCGFSEIQKPTDKVEPKFHKDDWIIHQGTENIYQVVAVIDNQYQLKYGDNYTIQNCADVDRCARLWDITKDAKDGDVLYLQKDGKEHIIIYKGVIKERFRTFVSAYCAYNGIVDAFCFADVSRYVDIAYRGIMPATKEQRDILFKKMKEAGYEWDSEKKELKKIEQKPAWSEEDEKIKESIITGLEMLKDGASDKIVDSTL